MKQNIDNHLEYYSMNDYIGGNQNNFYISMFQDEEREFVVTHNANIKPVSYFTGREIELQELRQKIEDGHKFILVSGMGGIGKTYICRKLFEEYLQKHIMDGNGLFRHIGFIEYDGDMGSSLQKCLKFKQQDSPEHNLEAAWKELEYLASDGKLLLFVDNVNTSIGSDTGLERLKHIPGTIILTSRRTSFSREFEPYQIGFLSMDQCRQVYEKIRFEDSGKRVNDEDAPILEYIIEKLAARHTLTVEFLAHLAQTKHWTVQKLRDELQNNGFQLEYINQENTLINIQKSYEVLYDLSELTNAERNIMEAFCIFPYIPLSTEICNQWLLEDAGASEDDDILMKLYRKGWLQYDIEQESYTLHPVFAQFIYQKCKPKAEKHSRLIHSCEESLKIPENGSPLVCQQYLPFAENIMKKLDMKEDVNQIMLIDSVAYLLQYISEYKKAEELYEKSLWIRKRVLGEEYPDTATSYNNLAEMYARQGEYGKAEELYKKSLQIRKRVLGEEHPDTAASYNNLAGVYARQGEYRKAEELYKMSLRIIEKVVDEGHPNTVASYNNLAEVYARQGEYRKAKELYEKSLRIREKVLGEEHPSTATSYDNLAGVYVRQGEYRKAEELYEKSLQIREKVLGKEHPSIAVGYNNLIEVYEKQKEYGKEEELYKKSLQIRERVLGEEHPDTMASYNNLAGVYKSQGEYRKAKELYEKSLRIKNSVFYGDYIGRDLYITTFQDNERKFVITHNTNIKSVSYFIGREMELQELRHKIEDSRKSILVYGRNGIGKTQICRKLFEEYTRDEKGPFQYIGYIDYNGDMGSSLKNCLKYKEQVNEDLNQEVAWRKLEYLASDGKLLLFIDNVNNVDQAMRKDSGLKRLNSIPGTIVITSRQTSSSDEFETYQIGVLNTKQCREMYEKIRFKGSGKKIMPEEVQNLEYVIENLAERHTNTIELLAHLARTKHWSIKRLRNELEEKHFRLDFHRNEESINIHKSYKMLYDNKTIFLSYNWHDREIANRIYTNLSKFPNIEVKRDVRNIAPWKSIRDFMESIRQQDYAVLIVSDLYLKSKNCMFEVTEIMKEKEYAGRIFPVVVEHKIYDALIRVKYIKYWQDECKKLEAAIKELDSINAAEPINDLKCYQSIAASIGEFLSMVADMNNPDIGEIEKVIEKAIFKNS